MTDPVTPEADELREAAQEWADGKSVMFDSDVRLVEAVNAALAAFDSLAAQLEEAQERERTCAICGHEWRRHDPEDGCCDAGATPFVGFEREVVCLCGRDVYFMQRRISQLSRAALNSQTHGGGE